MILVTTSRNPSRNTRAFARALSTLVPDSVHVNRGKKNIYSVIESAKSKGLPRACIVSDYRGNPGKIEFLVIGQRDWDWDQRVVKVLGVALSKEKQKAYEACVEGERARDFCELFGVESLPEGDLKVEAGKEAIKFTRDDDVLLNIKVEWR